MKWQIVKNQQGQVHISQLQLFVPKEFFTEVFKIKDHYIDLKGMQFVNRTIGEFSKDNAKLSLNYKF